MAGWVKPTATWARPPQLGEPGPRERHEGLFGDRLVVEDAELDGENFDTTELVELTVESSGIAAVSLVGVDVEARWTSFEGCDLSQAKVHRMRGCRVVDARCTGLDASDGELMDVVFERCLLNVANLRMARVQRVAFVDCVFTEVDAYEAVLTDVSFEGSAIEDLNLDGASMKGVDLRGATSVGLSAARSLDGCLASTAQLQEMLYELAFGAGLSVERLEG
jgi:uncharacterized protein YjbI with pentapeptide repeats